MKEIFVTDRQKDRDISHWKQPSQNQTEPFSLNYPLYGYQYSIHSFILFIMGETNVIHVSMLVDIVYFAILRIYIMLNQL